VNKEIMLEDMKAVSIPEGWSNMWYVMKTTVPQDTETLRHGKCVMLPTGVYTFLYRLTDSTIYNMPPGDLVMEDTPFELNTHIGFVLRAYGNVLVTGLGLGCVVRGLLANPNVTRVVCVENSPDVLKLVAPHMPTDRLAIIEADAFRWIANNKERFDCAWHDLWTNRDAGEPHLDVWHTRLLIECRRFAKQQGAWALNRTIKQKMVRHGFQWLG
jgi:hypothetical protein